MPDRVDALGNRYYRIVTVGDFLMRFSRELWDFLQDTNLVPRRCAQIALGCRSDIAAVTQDSMLHPVDGQRWGALAEDSIRLFRKGSGRVSTSPMIAGRADNAGIARTIWCAKKRKAPALGRRLEMPVDDLGTPSPHEGSICCEKETDRFSICYGHDVSVRRE